MELVRSIRNLRADMKVPPAQRISVNVLCDEPERYKDAEGYIMKLAGADKVSIASERGDNAKSDMHIACTGMEAFIPLSSLVDIEKEKQRVEKEIERVKGEIARADGKLSNERFVAKAPAAVVEEERNKLKTLNETLLKLEQRRTSLN